MVLNQTVTKHSEMNSDAGFNCKLNPFGLKNPWLNPETPQALTPKFLTGRRADWQCETCQNSWYSEFLAFFMGTKINPGDKPLVFGLPHFQTNQHGKISGGFLKIQMCFCSFTIAVQLHT